MLRARCLSSASRALFPEVFTGMYTDLEYNDIAETFEEEERDVEVQDGEVIITH